MILQDLLYKVPLQSLTGSTGLKINAISMDARKVEPGAVFVAIRGTQSDGHDYIDQAINAGATAIVCEKLPVSLQEHITYITVKNSHLAVAYMAHNFYGEPSTKIKLIGITGTNGKTTIATTLFQLFSELGYHCGLISTVQNQVGATVSPATHTTPDAVSLNALLAQMVAAGCSHVFMECSSHAIDQHRITGLDFTGGIFSNITHDHLDYHKTFDSYIRTKKSFFDSLPGSAFALSNLDDKRGTVMLQNSTASKHYYSLKNMAEIKGKILENSLSGLVMMVNDQLVHFRLVGEFNAYNILAVYGTAVLLGENSHEVLRILSMLPGAEGRFDCFQSDQGIIGIIDYAHTPDALENVLVTIKKLRKGDEAVITVVGCGGDRDKLKRPLMAEVACEWSTRVIFTSDNPRSEDPQTIIDDMNAGLKSAAKRKSISILDRKEAIKTAVSLAHPEDIILIAGKGHEKYQEIKGVKHSFDDKQVLKQMFSMLEK